MRNKKRIGIITLPFTPNYGWLLQVWAMQRIVSKLGNDPILIYRKWDLVPANSNILARIKRFLYYHVLCKSLYSFFCKNIKKTKLYRSSEQIKSVIEDYSLQTIIVGSDQVWRFVSTRGVGFNFFVDFDEKDKVQKFSYAASFGYDYWSGTKEEAEHASMLLSRFTGISVREDSGVSICRDILHVNAVQVLDPTMLVDIADYNSLAPRRLIKEGKVLSTYILDLDENKENFIKKMAVKMQLDEMVSLYVDNRKSRVHRYRPLEYWLSGIRDADFVIVDSFHGMVFCILFHKQFLVIGNRHRGMTRFESLLKLLNIQDRLICNVENYKVDTKILPIDYEAVDSKLRKLKKESMDFINKNI